MLSSVEARLSWTSRHYPSLPSSGRLELLYKQSWRDRWGRYRTTIIKQRSYNVPTGPPLKLLILGLRKDNSIDPTGRKVSYRINRISSDKSFVQCWVRKYGVSYVANLVANAMLDILSFLFNHKFSNKLCYEVTLALIVFFPPWKSCGTSGRVVSGSTVL